MFNFNPAPATRPHVGVETFGLLTFSVIASGLIGAFETPDTKKEPKVAPTAPVIQRPIEYDPTARELAERDLTRRLQKSPEVAWALNELLQPYKEKLMAPA